MRRQHVLLIVLTFTLIFSTCTDMGVPPEPPPGIILGESIEGIHLGYTAAQVVEKLGPPVTTGWASGADRGWRTFYWGALEDGSTPLTVFFIGWTDEHEGPVDLIVVRKGYRGKSEEGLGIGSRRQNVLQVLGPPQKIAGPIDSIGTGFLLYCRNRTNMHIHLTDDTVDIIGLGPLVPDAISPRCE